MHSTATLSFVDAEAGRLIGQLSDVELDELNFGVIGFDRDTLVVAYNAFESQAAGLDPSRVMGRRLFDVVAPCVNNFMVAHRFEEAATTATELDALVPYVLTLRMRPVKVTLRLLSHPDRVRSHVLVQRNAR